MIQPVSILKLAEERSTAVPLLTIELIPESTWSINVRSEVSKEEWDTLRKYVYRKANYRCDVCRGRGPKWPVECHEIWEFDKERSVQRLAGLTALCPDCHQVKHYGRARVIGKEREAFQHLMRVNSWTDTQAREHVRSAMDLWAVRSEVQWTVDLTWLKAKGVNVAPRTGNPGKLAVSDSFDVESTPDGEVTFLELSSDRVLSGFRLDSVEISYLMAGAATILVGLERLF